MSASFTLEIIMTHAMTAAITSEFCWIGASPTIADRPYHDGGARKRSLEHSVPRVRSYRISLPSGVGRLALSHLTLSGERYFVHMIRVESINRAAYLLTRDI